jgi:hypothetical protein
MAQKAPDTVRRWITVPPDWLEVRKVTVLSDPALEKLDEGGGREGSAHQKLIDLYRLDCAKKGKKLRMKWVAA